MLFLGVKGVITLLRVKGVKPILLFITAETVIQSIGLTPLTALTPKNSTCKT